MEDIVFDKFAPGHSIIEATQWHPDPKFGKFIKLEGYPDGKIQFFEKFESIDDKYHYHLTKFQYKNVKLGVDQYNVVYYKDHVAFTDKSKTAIRINPGDWIIKRNTNTINYPCYEYSVIDNNDFKSIYLKVIVLP